MNDILGIMLGLVVLLIFIKHSLPSLSSLFKEKIMGIRPSESFDLDELVQKKMNLYQIEQGQAQDLFEKNLQLNHKKQTLKFVHTLSWDANTCFDELNEEAKKLGTDHIPPIERMKQTFEQLKKIPGFEDGPALELKNLKIFLLFYTLFFSEMTPEQRMSFYRSTYQELVKPELNFDSIVIKYQAEFSPPT